VVLVGEAPGDMEDRAGRPFVGPAGRLLDEALAVAGIDRAKVYISNVVKHFPWEDRSSRRIPRKPLPPEIAACRPWLDAELTRIRPVLIICLGATAAQTFLGRDFLVTRRRGELLPGDPYAGRIMATIHPSAILRVPGAEGRQRAVDALVADLRHALPLLS
jgi:DNA polymerase